jgi:hypothetical protein
MAKVVAKRAEPLFGCVGPVAMWLAVATEVAVGPLRVENASARSSVAAGEAALQSYAHSRYGHCGAKKVADVWKTDVAGGKVVIGDKTRRRSTDLVDRDIASATGVRCAWDETDLTFQDAQRLAAYWGRPMEAAKLKATNMVSEMGTKKFRRTVLEHAPPA